MTVIVLMYRPLSSVGDELGRFICIQIIRFLPIYKRHKQVLKNATTLTIDALMDCDISKVDKKALWSMRKFFPSDRTEDFSGIVRELESTGYKISLKD